MVEIKRTCNIPGCEGKHDARGLCQKHYVRFKKHGRTEQTRPFDWGNKEKHPLYQTWCWHRRSANVAKMCQEWYDDFWLFVKDVGERPSKNHFLRAIQQEEKISAANSRWVERIRTNSTEEKKARNSLYAKEWRKNNPERCKSYSLKRYFGITLEEYEVMVEAQDGLCAICGEKEFAKHHLTNEIRDLAVDHDHKTGKVRGLLCTNCNKGLGHFQDDIELIMAAGIYLETHKEVHNEGN